MKRVLLIGKDNEDIKVIKEAVSAQCQVMCCPEEEDEIKEMLRSEKTDIIIVSLSGSAVAARETFNFLLTSGIPILGIGTPKHEAELIINGILSEPGVRFLSKPAKADDIIKCVKELGASNEGQATVLLVDDSSVFLHANSVILSKKYKVDVAQSAAQAIIAISRNKPDIILLDYEMPVCDGKMTLEILRAEKDMRDIPVVFLTGISDGKHVNSVLDLHPQGYLLKPCSEDMLFAMVEKVLNSRKR